MITTLRRLVVVLVVMFLAPASALSHAVLVESAPGNDVLLKASPKEIVLTFSESVDPVGAVQVFDGDAQPVAVDGQTKRTSISTATGLREELLPGTYTVAWRALSADGHAINGAFVFHVKKRGPNPEGIIGTIGTGTPPAWMRTLSSMARWWNLTTLILIIGGVLALTTFMSRRAGAGEAKLWYIVSAVGFVLAISSAVSIVLQGAELRGLTIGGTNTGGMIGDVVTTRFGTVRLTQLLLAQVIAIVAVWGVSTHRGPPTLVTLWAAAAALAVTPALSGHAIAIGPVAVISDAVHVAAVAAWIGGLAFVVTALAMAGTERGQVARDIVPRFSRVALLAAGTVVLTGAISGLLELGGIGNLFTTRYGWHLSIKIGLAILLLGVGAMNRRIVPQVASPANAAPVRRLRRQMGIELGLVGAVLAITTLLVAEPPSRAVGSGTGPITVTTTADRVNIRLVVEPARVGPNTVHAYLSRDARSVDPDEVRMSFTNKDANLGPISAPTERNEPGHYIARSAPLTAAGEWEVTVRMREGEFDSTQATVRIKLQRVSSGRSPA